MTVLALQTEVAGAEVTFEKDRSHGALTGPAHCKRACHGSFGLGGHAEDLWYTPYTLFWNASPNVPTAESFNEVCGTSKVVGHHHGREALVPSICTVLRQYRHES